MLFVSSSLAGQANVFVYHRFNEPRYPSTNISRADFRAHLELLRQQGTSVLSLGQVVDALKQGRALPQPCAVISVDDSYRSFMSDGWPLLREFGYPATLFVSTDSVGRGDYLGWPELRMLQEQGVEIGNHSASHDYLLDLKSGESPGAWTARVAEEFNRSQQAFIDQLGKAPALFAYPYGEFSVELQELVKNAGFTAAFGQQSGVLAAPENFFSLPRFPVAGRFSELAGFRSKLFMKSLPVHVLSPESNLLADHNPPLLRFELSMEEIDSASLRCFAPGAANCQISPVMGEPGVFEVVAGQPLQGRRSKYTVTAADKEHRTWFWFSQLWVRPSGHLQAGQPVSR